MSEISITSLKCSNCGAPLPAPNGPVKRIMCPYCSSENIIEGVEKNAEILSKENIMGGLKFELNDPTVHKMIVETLCKSECPPVDIFTEVDVRRARKVVVPAYWFDNCTGTATVSYEKGVEREQQQIVGKGDKMRTVTKKVTEWTPMTMAVNDTCDFIVSGNKDYTELFKRLYPEGNNPELVDVELLDYPAEANALSYDIPDAVVFNNQVKPHMEDILDKKAKRILEGGMTRNVSLSGGSSIQKGEMRRISMPVYDILLDYKGKDYSLYFTGNGGNVVYDSLPVDFERRDLINAKQKAIKKFISPLKILFTVLGIMGCVLGLIMLLTGIFAIKTCWGCIPIGVVLLAGAVFAFINMVKQNKIYLADKAKMQAELDAIIAEFTDAKKKFIESKTALKGVFISLTENPEAFDGLKV